MLIKSTTVPVPPMHVDHSSFLSRLRPASGEIPIGYGERATRHLGFHDVRSMLKRSGSGVTLKDLCDGKNLGAFAAAFDLPPEIFARSAIERLSRVRYRLNNVEFSRELLVHGSIRVCPHCYREDLTCLPGPVELRPHLRTLSFVKAITCCPEHGVKYVGLAADHTLRRLDFQRALRDLRFTLPPATRASDMELALSRLLAHRLEATAGRPEPELFQGLPFGQILPACREIGRLALEVAPDSWSGEACELVGCRVLFEGPQMYKALVLARFAILSRDRRWPTLQAALGEFYSLLRRMPRNSRLWRVTRDITLREAIELGSKRPRITRTLPQLAVLIGLFLRKRSSRLASSRNDQLDLLGWSADNATA